MDDGDVIDAAKLIRPYVADLVGPDRAAELDSTIGTILATRSDVQDIHSLYLQPQLRFSARA